MSWFAKFYVYQENIDKHRNREFKNNNLVGLEMNEKNTGISYRYNSSGGIKTILIFTNAKVTGTDEPVTTMDTRTYYDEDSAIPNYSSVNLSLITGDIYGITTFYTTGESLVASNIYEFPTETELTTYLNLDDSEKDLYAQEHAGNYDAVQIGICDWKIYVGNLNILSQLQSDTNFNVRVDNSKINNDNLNDFSINIYAGCQYYNELQEKKYFTELYGTYSITNSVIVTATQLANLVDSVRQQYSQNPLGEYYICVSLKKGNFESAIMGGRFRFGYSGISDTGTFPIDNNPNDGSTIDFFWNESPLTDIDYSQNEDTIEEGETP